MRRWCAGGNGRGHGDASSEDSNSSRKSDSSCSESEAKSRQRDQMRTESSRARKKMSADDVAKLHDVERRGDAVLNARSACRGFYYSVRQLKH